MNSLSPRERARVREALKGWSTDPARIPVSNIGLFYIGRGTYPRAPAAIHPVSTIRNHNTLVLPGTATG